MEVVTGFVDVAVVCGGSGVQLVCPGRPVTRRPGAGVFPDPEHAWMVVAIAVGDGFAVWGRGGSGIYLRSGIHLSSRPGSRRNGLRGREVDVVGGRVSGCE